MTIRANLLGMIVFSAMLAVVSAAPRVAMVRVKEIYAGLPSVARLQEEVDEARKAIIREPRAEELRQALNELRELEAKLSDKTNPPEGDAGRKLAQAYELKRQAAQTLQREFEVLRTDLERKINRRMVDEMRATLDLVADTARRLAAERGYDMLLNSSGNSNTGVPFVLYAGNQTDLTDDVRAALKDIEAAKAPSAPDASAAGTQATPANDNP